MKTTTTIDKSNVDQLKVDDLEQPVRATVATPTAPVTPESLIQAICLDAQHDSLKFVLRSDTGHDGE